MRRILLTSCLIAAFAADAILAAVCAAASTDLAIVSQKDRAFVMKEVHVRPGGTVRFTNDDEFSHQIYVQSASFSFESEEQEPQHNLDVGFPKSGTFDVQCHIHPKMHLRVDVR